VAENLKTTQAINKLLKERQALMKSMNNDLTRQVALQRDMCSALECADTDAFENLRNSGKEAAEAIKEAEKATEDTTKEIGKMEKAVRKAKAGFRKFGAGIRGVFGGIMSAILASIGVLKSFYKHYIDKMHEVIKQLERVQEAQENVRKKFGSLTKGPGKMVIKDAQAMGRAFSKMGVSAGFGYDAAINLINKMGELYGAMDPGQLAGFARMSQDNRIEMGKLAMAAGYSGEEIGQLNNTFRAMGEDGVSAVKDVTLRSHRLSATLGISAKQAHKGFSQMIRNVKAFGNANRAEMESAMSKATQLGISIKDLAGISDAFFTFDKAAENVSKLSQAFGTQIDTMKMLNAASPADQLDQMREAMFRAGKSAETLSRHELALLAQSSGLSEEAARLAFSQESQYMSQEELAAKMAETDPQQQMVKAMQDVAKEIENVVVKMSDMMLDGKGFFESFIEGISQSLFLFGRITGASASFRTALVEVYEIGRELGDTLLDFDFIREMFEGTDNTISKMPKLFQMLSNAIKSTVAPINAAYKSFKAFFGASTQAEQTKAFNKMLKNLKKAFTNFTTSLFGGSGASQMGGKIKHFLNMTADVVIPQVVKLITMIAKRIWKEFKKLPWKQQLGVAVFTMAALLPGLLLSAIGGVFKGIGKLLWKPLKWAFKKIPWSRLGNFIKGPGLRGIGSAFTWIIKKIPLILLLWAAVKPVIGLFGDIKKRFMDAARAGGGFMDSIKALGGIMSDFIGRALEWAVGVADLVSFGLLSKWLDPDKFAASWDTFTYEVKDMFKGLWSNTIMPAIETWLTGVGELKRIGKEIIGGVWDGLKEQWTLISTWWRDKWQQFRDWLPGSEPKDPSSPFRNLANAGRAMMGNVLDGLNKIPGVAKAKEAFANVANIIKDPGAALKAVGEKVKAGVDFVSSAMAGAKNILLEGLRSFSGAIIEGVSIMAPALLKVTELSGSASTAFRSFAGVFKEVGDIFSGVGRGSVDVDVVTNKLARAAAGIAKMTETLATVDTVNLQTKVEEILGSGVFAGENSADKGKVQINLNVHMDAAKLARAIVETRVIPGT